jgi:hypothetical protein
MNSSQKREEKYTEKNVISGSRPTDASHPRWERIEGEC